MKCLLYLLITVFIIITDITHINLLCSLGKKRDMILSAKKIRAIITARDFFHSSLVICVVLCIKCDLLHCICFTCQTIHQVVNEWYIVCSLCSTYPCTTPVICLWSLTYRVVSIYSVSSLCRCIRISKRISH